MYPDADVFVLDVLPTPIPYLVQTAKCVIYYCHFPDKLLTRDTVNGEKVNANANANANATNANCSVGVGVVGGNNGIKALLKSHYRKILDQMEEWAMSYADLICVNSNFTKTEVSRAFPSLKGNGGGDGDGGGVNANVNANNTMQVLYPAIDLNKFIPPDFTRKQELIGDGRNGDDGSEVQMPIVSLNRFERKKNIEVLLHAYASIYKKNTSNGVPIPPPLVISGGYDPRNAENVEYLTELKELAESLGIQENTKFRPSVSDEERAILLQSAICVVYTPHREHFGIVPLEAMYAGSAVVAIKSGGPKETVLDGVTGILVDMIPGDSCEKLADAIGELLNDPAKAIEMGKRGHEHVKEKFGLKPFQREWKRLVLAAIPRGHKRQESASRRVSLFFTYAFLLLAWYLATYLLQGTSWCGAKDTFTKVDLYK